MHMSRPIEDQGRFLGVAVTHAPVTHAQGAAVLWRFIATDPAVEELDGALFATPAEAQRSVARHIRRGLLAPPPGIPASLPYGGVAPSRAAGA